MYLINLRKERIISVNMSNQIAGFFKIEAIRPDGRRRLLCDWQPNLITNNGLDEMGGGHKVTFEMGWKGWIAYCRLGTGNTTPLVTDTVLDVHLAEASKISFTEGEQLSTTPYYLWQKNVYRFAQGEATGIIAEIGIAPRIGNGLLSTRSLILDSNDDPTTITIAADEQVDVTYEFRSYMPDISEQISTMTIDSVLYNTKRKPMGVTSSRGGAFTFGAGVPTVLVYNGVPTPNIGAEITDTPSSNMQSINTVLQTYGAGNHYLDMILTIPYTAAFWGTKGVTAIGMQGWLQRWQMSFTQDILNTWGIPHDNTNELVMNIRHTWDRYSPP